MGGLREREIVRSRSQNKAKKKDGKVVETIVGGFNHCDAICSTPFFELMVDIIPGEMRGVCVQVCVRVAMGDGEGQNRTSRRNNAFNSHEPTVHL